MFTSVASISSAGYGFVVNKSADKVRNPEEVKGLMELAVEAGFAAKNISAHAIRRPIIHWIAGNPPEYWRGLFHLGAWLGHGFIS